MRKLCSILVLAGFLLISALANLGNNYAVASIENGIESASLVALSVASTATNSIVDPSQQDNIALNEDGTCACKSDADSKKFTCGVTLALLAQAEGFLPIPFQKSRVSCADTLGLKNYVDLLKKPPRTLL